MGPGGHECDEDDSHRYDGRRGRPVKVGLIESLARPGGNVTGITLLATELGGKRLELFKEAVPKLARVAVLYDPANPGNVGDVKEALPIAARALGLDYSALGGTRCGRFREGIRCLKQAAPGWTLRATETANVC
jgi:ABC transporter substrate binding protein